MKKPKIKIDVWTFDDQIAVCVWAGNHRLTPRLIGSKTKKEAREWAKDWCRTVGAALTEKGK
jgi:hypothetical protein